MLIFEMIAILDGERLETYMDVNYGLNLLSHYFTMYACFYAPHVVSEKVRRLICCLGKRRYSTSINVYYIRTPFADKGNKALIDHIYAVQFGHTLGKKCECG